MSSTLANERFNVGEVFEVPEDAKPLFEKPCVGKEEIEVTCVPHTLNVGKIIIEVFFNDPRFVYGVGVFGCEAFSENVGTLVMFML